MTKFNELQIKSHKSRKRVGRGIAAGQGKTAGRGTKGQGARAGKKLSAIFQGGQRALVQAVPKVRGFKSMRSPAQVVYLNQLNAFKDKTVDNFSLFEDGYIATPFHAVKVITRGELTVRVAVHLQAPSKTSQIAITKNGGQFVKSPTPIKKTKEK